MVFTDETTVVVIELIQSRFETDCLLPYCYTIEVAFLMTKLTAPNKKKKQTCKLNLNPLDIKNYLHSQRFGLGSTFCRESKQNYSFQIQICTKIFHIDRYGVPFANPFFPLNYTLIYDPMCYIT